MRIEFNFVLLILYKVIAIKCQEQECGRTVKYIQTLLSGISHEQSQSISAYTQLIIDFRKAQENAAKEASLLRAQLNSLNSEVRVLKDTVTAFRSSHKNLIAKMEDEETKLTEELSISRARTRKADEEILKLTSVANSLHENVKNILNTLKSQTGNNKCRNSNTDMLDLVEKEITERVNVAFRQNMKPMLDQMLSIESDSEKLSGVLEDIKDKCFEINPGCNSQNTEDTVNVLENMFSQLTGEIRNKFELQEEQLRKQIEKVHEKPPNMPRKLPENNLKPIVVDPENPCNKRFSIHHPNSCAELRKDGVTCDGAYIINLPPQIRSALVNCDMTTDGGGWTVIMRRGDNGIKKTRFDLSWPTYSRGFGNIQRDFWIGNNMLHSLTSQQNTVLRINLESFDNEVLNLTFNNFSVGNISTKYILSIGDEINGKSNYGISFQQHNGKPFSTHDKYNGEKFGDENCASKHRAGWWFDQCRSSALLTAPYYDEKDVREEWDGIQWRSWKNNQVLKSVEMKIRPAEFDPDIP